MSNINQYQFEELPGSKIIITEEVLNRLHKLIGRSSYIASEHSSFLFGKRLPGVDDIWLIDGVNDSEDYITRGADSKSPFDYSVQPGIKQSNEAFSIAESSPGTVVIDVHTHPSGLIDDYRFMSRDDLQACIDNNKRIADKRGTFFSGLIGVDRVNGNMSFSVVWYNKNNNRFYRIQDIYLRVRLGNGDYRDCPFIKYGDTQLIMETWGHTGAIMNQNSERELQGLKYR